MNYIDQLKIKGILYTLKDPTVADQINARIQELIGTAPANLDTLQELAAAISSGDEAVEGILTTLATKTSKEYVDNLFANIQLTPGPQGETGPQGPKGDTGTFDYSDLADYVTNTALGTKIGNLGTTIPVYSFESYSSNGAVKYGEGTVKPTGETGTDVAEVIVVTNTSTDPNAAEFAGQKFWIADDATVGDTLYQLLDAEGQEVGIAVKITAIDVRDLTVKEYVDALDLKKADKGDSYTKQESDAKYLTTHQDISGKADKSQLTPLEAAAQKVSHMPEFGEFINSLTTWTTIFENDNFGFEQCGPNYGCSGPLGELETSEFTNKYAKVTINGITTILNVIDSNSNLAKYEYAEPYQGYFNGIKIGISLSKPYLQVSFGNLNNDMGLNDATQSGSTRYGSVKIELSDALDDIDIVKIPKKYLPLPTKVSELTNDAGYLTSHQNISGKVNITSIGAANGVASLNAEGKVPASQLPSYVDDVIEGYIMDGKFYEGRTYGIPNHEYVDLGLPSGTKWATMNLGASSVEGYGNYYKYGNGATVISNGYEGSRYTGQLDDEHDSATQVWGANWQVPSKTQFEELIENTTAEWTTVNDINGVKFTAQNGNYIFFPAAGLTFYGSINSVGSIGWYMSSVMVSNLYVLRVNQADGGTVTTYNDLGGFTVRPVLKTSEFPDEGIDEITPESDKIYVDKDSNKTYRWSGSAYVEISPSVVVGTNTGNAADGKVVDDHIKDTTSHITAAERTAWNAKVDASLIGNLGNASEAVPATYYTAEEAATYNTENSLQEGDQGYKSEGDVKTEAVDAVPYTTVMEVILDKYQALLARIETLENA